MGYDIHAQYHRTRTFQTNDDILQHQTKKNNNYYKTYSLSTKLFDNPRIHFFTVEGHKLLVTWHISVLIGLILLASALRLSQQTCSDHIHRCTTTIDLCQSRSNWSSSKVREFQFDLGKVKLILLYSVIIVIIVDRRTALLQCFAIVIVVILCAIAE